MDLLVTHDWGPIKLLLNAKGRLRDATGDAGLAKHLGWWQGIAGRDLDADGDIDYVATNRGRNTSYHPTAERPAKLFSGNFAEASDKPVLIEAEYNEAGQLVPTRNKPDVEKALSSVEIAFPSFHEFASATLAEIVGEAKLASATQLSANFADSAVLRNDGRGHFTVEPLPVLAQVSPGFGVLMSDFNADGHTDVYLTQNQFSTRREIGRWDGGVSALLLGAGLLTSPNEGAGSVDPPTKVGDPRTTLVALPPRESGLLVPEDAKSAVISDITGDGWPDIVVGVNDGKPIAFEHQGVPKCRIVSVRLRGKAGNPTAAGARVTLVRSDGLRQTAEVTAGGGYLSQQSPILWFGLGPTAQAASIEIRWPDGKSSRYSPKPNESAILIEQPGRTPNG